MTRNEIFLSPLIPMHGGGWGGCDQRNSLLLLNSDKQEIVLNPGGFALLSTYSTVGNFVFYENQMKASLSSSCLWEDRRKCLLIRGAGGGAEWLAGIIWLSDYFPVHLIVGLFRISARTRLLPAGVVTFSRLQVLAMVRTNSYIRCFKIIW